MLSWDCNLKFTPNGSQTLSKMPNRFVEGVYPKLLEAGVGQVVWDLEGREYVDLICGLGAISVGHNNLLINSKIQEQMRRGVLFSLPNRLEGEVAEYLTQLVPFTEQWKFLKTGTEGTMAAVKAARAYTGRDKIMTCGYHGWLDWYSIQNDRKAGIPEFNSLLVKKAIYNDISSFSDLETKKYAAVIIEPYIWEMPKDGFFEYLRDLCSATGTLLIFDEVVTGGRTENFVAANYFGIQPDFIVISKGIGNGFPLAAVGGKQSLMQTFERDDFFVSGTFGGECLSLVACLATCQILVQEIGRMVANGTLIKNYFNDLFLMTGAKCKGYPTRLTFDFPTPNHKALFMQEMCFNGVLVGYSNMTTAMMTKKDLEKVLNAMRVANSVLIDNWENPLGALKGNVPVETLRLR